MNVGYFVLSPELSSWPWLYGELGYTMTLCLHGHLSGQQNQENRDMFVVVHRTPIINLQVSKGSTLAWRPSAAEAIE